MGSGWLIENIYSELATSSFKNHLRTRIEDIAQLAFRQNEAKLATYIAVCGANGIGKSYSSLCLAKVINPAFASDGKKRTLYATEKTSDYLRMMEANKNDLIVVDEGNRYLGSRDWKNPKQISLINQMEINRADRITHIINNRGYFSLSSRFRNEQASIIIWGGDRAVNKKSFAQSYSYVFASPAIFSGDERWGLEPLKYAGSQEAMNNLVQKIPSFVGFLFTPDIEKYFTKDEIRMYEAKKAEGINKASAKNIDYVERMEAKEEGHETAGRLEDEAWDELKIWNKKHPSIVGNY